MGKKGEGKSFLRGDHEGATSQLWRDGSTQGVVREEKGVEVGDEAKLCGDTAAKAVPGKIPLRKRKKKEGEDRVSSVFLIFSIDEGQRAQPKGARGGGQKDRSP